MKRLEAYGILGTRRNSFAMSAPRLSIEWMQERFWMKVEDWKCILTAALKSGGESKVAPMRPF
jgi:hypothetical protein